MMGHRYYDTEIGRSINPDDVDYLDPTSIGGLNLYACCNNGPVNYCDPSRRFAISVVLLIIGVIIGTAIGDGIEVAKEVIINDGDWSKLNADSIVSSAIIGGTMGYAADKLINHDEMKLSSTVAYGFLTMIEGAFAYGAGTIS